jgi:hypothetical protein
VSRGLIQVAGAYKHMQGERVALLLRIRQSLKDRLVDLAKHEHRSLNQQIEFLLEHSLSTTTANLSDPDHPEKTGGKRKL